MLSAEEMRSVESAAIGSGRVTGAVLMARAGAGTVDEILRFWPELNTGEHSAVVLCGPGNNGGDGYVIACHLAALGWQVTVCAMGDGTHLPEDAQANHDRWCAIGEVQPLSAAPAAMRGADLVVDALFGIGLTRPLSGAVADAVAAVPITAKRVAVDVPSGYDTNTGAKLGGAVFTADLVVTFHARKPVHGTLDAAVRVVDIGL